MAASMDLTERCHIVLVRGLWSTLSLAVSTLDNSHLLILGHLAPPTSTSTDIKLSISEFFLTIANK